MRLVLIAFLIVFSFFSLLWLLVVIAALSGEDDDLHTYDLHTYTQSQNSKEKPFC